MNYRFYTPGLVLNLATLIFVFLLKFCPEFFSLKIEQWLKRQTFMEIY